MKFSSLGTAPTKPDSNPRWHNNLLETVEVAICLAWNRLKDRSDTSIANKDEDQITNELVKELRNIRRHGDVAKFIPEIFGVPTRDSKIDSIDGKSIDQMPDITIYPANPRQAVINETQDALFYECKVLDTNRNLDRYRADGINRYLDGNYAWAMQHAGMIAYVFERQNKCPISSLQKYFRRQLNEVTISDLLRCHEEPFKITSAPGCNASDIALTKHDRNLMPKLDIRHLWLY